MGGAKVAVGTAKPANAVKESPGWLQMYDHKTNWARRVDRVNKTRDASISSRTSHALRGAVHCGGWQKGIVDSLGPEDEANKNHACMDIRQPGARLKASLSPIGVGKQAALELLQRAHHCLHLLSPAV